MSKTAEPMRPSDAPRPGAAEGVAPASPALAPDLVPVLLDAYRIRRAEQSLLELFSGGRVRGTIHTCIGEELSALAICGQLADGDVILSGHRCHGHYIARFRELRSLVAEILGHADGLCQGFGGSQHLYRPGFFSSGIQGGQTPAAVGIALARKASPAKDLVVVFIGDGTLGQGVVYESLNLASKLQVPLLFVVEDNLWAQSTSQRETLAGSVEGRASAFGIPYYAASTFEPQPLFATARAAIERVRASRAPALLHVSTYRLAAHSKGDDHRDPAEIESYRRRDPLSAFLAQASGAHAQALAAIDAQVHGVVESLLASPATARVTTEAVPERTRAVLFSRAPAAGQKTTMVRELNRALTDLMAENPDCWFLGEDVRDPYGGAFTASRGLSTRHPDRVLNMPISESAIVGTGLGLALEGKLAIAEIMFGDFVTLAFDQIVNHAGKAREMYGRRLPVRLVVRTPMGGRRGYGATHSQSLEKHLLGVPGTDLFVLHPHADVHGFYTRLCRGLERTAVVIEHKLLYGSAPGFDLPHGYELWRSDERFPTSWLRPPRPADLTVICFGGIGLELEKAARTLLDEEIHLDVFYPLHVNACSVRPMLDSLARTGKVLFVEEGTDGGTLGSEMLRRLIEAMPSGSLPRVAFTASSERPIPAAVDLEAQVLPGADAIARALLELFDA